MGFSGQLGKTTYRAWAGNGPDATEQRNEGTGPGATSELDNTDVTETTWFIDARRSVSIAAGRYSQQAGRSVWIYGAIDAVDPSCEDKEAVKLWAKGQRDKHFSPIATGTTGPRGGYGFSVRVWATRTYAVTAPATSTCNWARSRDITVTVWR